MSDETKSKRVSLPHPTREEILARGRELEFNPKRKPDKKFDDEAKVLFLNTYAQTGMVMYSAAVAGVHHSTVRRHLKSDELFAEAYESARQFHCESIETEIKRRAVKGWQEPVFQKGERVMEPMFDPATGEPKKNERGEIIMVPATVTRYSDRMLELHAKRHIPEYKDKHEVDVNISGGVLAIPTAALGKPQTSEDWEEKYGGETVDAEFERVAPEADAPLAPDPEPAPEHPAGPCAADVCEICRPHREDSKPKEAGDTRRIKRGY